MQIVDTNIFIDHLRGYRSATAFFDSLGEERIIFSAVTEAELIAGKQCADINKKGEIIQFLGRWQKIDVTNPIAVKAGDLTREHGLELADSFIAATALLYKAELLTRNVKDFQNIEGLTVKEPYK